MARLALVWELGSGSGYAAVMALIARVAIAEGHECVFIVRHLHAAARLLPPELGVLVQAPASTAASAEAVRVQTSYATLLHNCGFGDVDALAARLRAWQALYRAFGIERVLACHSPTAVLAARMLELPLLHYGTGFSIPPETSPWPGFRPDLAVPGRALLHNEAKVLGVVNQALQRLGAPPLPRLQALYAGVPTALLGYAELDHYAGAERPGFLGLPEISFGARPDWPDAAEPARLFVSLIPGSGARDWLSLLAALPARSLVRFHGGAAPKHAPSPRISVCTAPVSFAPAIAASTAVVGYASHNLVCEALLGGKPVALIAHNPEHLLLGRRVQALGAGPLLPQRPDADTARHLGALLADASYRSRAERFAERYRSQPRSRIAQTLLHKALDAAAVPLG
ncbi:MAG: glycosyltransferase [Gammaproteobacteria bacterium]